MFSFAHATVSSDRIISHARGRTRARARAKQIQFSLRNSRILFPSRVVSPIRRAVTTSGGQRKTRKNRASHKNRRRFMPCVSYAHKPLLFPTEKNQIQTVFFSQILRRSGGILTVKKTLCGRSKSVKLSFPREGDIRQREKLANYITIHSKLRLTETREVFVLVERLSQLC